MAVRLTINTLKSYFIFRLNFFIDLVNWLVVPIVISSIWLTFGYKNIEYWVVVFSVTALSPHWRLLRSFSLSMKRGDLSAMLLMPIDVEKLYYFKLVLSRALRNIPRVIVLIFLFNIIFKVSIKNILSFIFAIILAHIFSFFFYTSLFYIVSLSESQNIIISLFRWMEFLLSGAVIPLKYLKGKLYDLLPFKYLLAASYEVYTLNLNTIIAYLIYIAIFYFLSKISVKKSLKIYQAYG